MSQQEPCSLNHLIFVLVSLVCIYPLVFPLLPAAVCAAIIAASRIQSLLDAGRWEAVGLQEVGPGDQEGLPAHHFQSQCPMWKAVIRPDAQGEMKEAGLEGDIR